MLEQRGGGEGEGSEVPEGGPQERAREHARRRGSEGEGAGDSGLDSSIAGSGAPSFAVLGITLRVLHPAPAQRLLPGPRRPCSPELLREE